MLNHWLLVCQDSESPLASTTTSSAVPGGQGVGVGGWGLSLRAPLRSHPGQGPGNRFRQRSEWACILGGECLCRWPQARDTPGPAAARQGQAL